MYYSDNKLIHKFYKTVLNTGSKQQLVISKRWFNGIFNEEISNVISEEEVGLDYLMYHKDNGFFDHHTQEITMEEYHEILKVREEGLLNNSGKPLFVSMRYKK